MYPTLFAQKPGILPTYCLITQQLNKGNTTLLNNDIQYQPLSSLSVKVVSALVVVATLIPSLSVVAIVTPTGPLACH